MAEAAAVGSAVATVEWEAIAREVHLVRPTRPAAGLAELLNDVSTIKENEKEITFLPSCVAQQCHYHLHASCSSLVCQHS